LRSAPQAAWGVYFFIEPAISFVWNCSKEC